MEAINRDLDALTPARMIKCGVDEVSKYIQCTNHTLNIISQNIRSINCNMANFTTLLQRTKVPWDIIVLSECWLQTAKFIPDINSYSHVSTTKQKSQNEGVVIYFNRLLNIATEEPDVEDANCILVKVNNEICVLGIYRPPSSTNTSNFLKSIDTILTKLRHFRNIVLCGDINIDINPNGTDNRSHEYLSLLASHSMLPGYTEPTHGRTCLDHIIIKTKHEASCFLFQTSITDHDCVALSMALKLKLSRNYAKQQVDYETLDTVISNIDLNPVYVCSDTNFAANLLVSQLKTAIANSTIKTKTTRRKTIIKPWITDGLLQCMRNRDNLLKKSKKDPGNETLKIIYKRYRNFCKKILKKVKTKYEREEIYRTKNNKKQLWDVIKNISGSKRETDHSPALVSPDSPIQSINEVNNYFANVGKRLAENISPCDPKSCSCNKVSTISPSGSFVMNQTNESEIMQIIHSLRVRCAVGVDQISSTVLKRYAQLLAAPIAHICNLAISSGVFPSAFKLGQIKPIYKNGDKSRVDNYRPITILPTLSKILERLMNKRLVTYVESNNYLSPAQYGFRRGKSTNDAVHDLVNSIVNSLDKKRNVLSSFLTLQRLLTRCPFRVCWSS
jgi:hypothetical protein